MTVCQLQSTGIINYSEAVNNNIICPNNLMFSNITKCGNRNVHPKEFADTNLNLAIQTFCHHT